MAEILIAARARPKVAFLLWLERELRLARSSEPDAGELSVGGLVLDLAIPEARAGGKVIRLRPAEALALSSLMRQHARPVRYDALLRDIAIHADVGQKLVHVTISHLQRKLKEIGFERTISNVRGLGYLLRLRPPHPLPIAPAELECSGGATTPPEPSRAGFDT